MRSWWNLLGVCVGWLPSSQSAEAKQARVLVLLSYGKHAVRTPKKYRNMSGRNFGSLGPKFWLCR